MDRSAEAKDFFVCPNRFRFSLFSFFDGIAETAYTMFAIERE
ncbi:hypothetical protein HMPREF9087_2801 [Enterococcus casseliflavus ATCC 12755]|uniref:Uncharacterized protein n=1 Tax=Enterococcus casseliflavus ATCC 12755 TaxID=888066 RepID=F0EN09_ENTCA|nr:hypothetical protein HMPREF9087_2801 [Enterococcus casseliflavus ATCC 12755]